MLSDALKLEVQAHHPTQNVLRECAAERWLAALSLEHRERSEAAHARLTAMSA